jgi:hypothetical protein
VKPLAVQDETVLRRLRIREELGWVTRWTAEAILASRPIHYAGQPEKFMQAKANAVAAIERLTLALAGLEGER